MVSRLKNQQPKGCNSAADFHAEAKGEPSQWLMVLRPKRMLLNCHLLSRTRTVCCHPLLGSQHLTHSCAVKFYSTELQIHRKTFSNTGCLLCFSFSSELPLFSRTGHLSVLKMQWPWEQNLVPSLLPKLCLEK